MSQNLVSVLIPLYNHTRYIQACLESIRDDGWSNKEVLIIDDGSTDGSAEVAKAWYREQKPSNWTRFELISRPNRGLTRTLNELVGMASGQYLLLLASDDLLVPKGIASRVAYLQSHKDKLAVFGDCIVVDDKGIKTHESGIRDLYGGHVEMLANPELMDLELIYNWCVPGPGFMAHRDLYERLGGYDENLVVEDWDMYLRIAAHGMLGFIPQQVAAYRYHGENTVASRDKCIALSKCHIKSTWKYAWAFRGFKRLGLLYQHFRMKHEIAVIEGHSFTALYCRKIHKKLRKFTLERYKHLVDRVESP